MNRETKERPMENELHPPVIHCRTKSAIRTLATRPLTFLLAPQKSTEYRDEKCILSSLPVLQNTRACN